MVDLHDLPGLEVGLISNHNPSRTIVSNYIFKAIIFPLLNPQFKILEMFLEIFRARSCNYARFSHYTFQLNLFLSVTETNR